MTDIAKISEEALQYVKDMLPKLIEQRAKLSEQLSQLNGQIHKLQLLQESLTPAKRPPETRTKQRKRAERGLVYKQVDEVMATGKTFGFGQLQSELYERFGAKYGFSSVYRALKKGEKEKRYENEGRAWRLRK